MKLWLARIESEFYIAAKDEADALENVSSAARLDDIVSGDDIHIVGSVTSAKDIDPEWLSSIPFGKPMYANEPDLTVSEIIERMVP